MSLTALDIRNRQFSKSLRGFNEDEVNDFLSIIVKDYENFARDNKALKDQIEDINNQLKRFTNIEETLSKTIVLAQETADRTTANAEQEARLIIQGAENNANQIINDALARANKIELDIESLLNQYNQQKEKIKIHK